MTEYKCKKLSKINFSAKAFIQDHHLLVFEWNSFPAYLKYSLQWDARFLLLMIIWTFLSSLPNSEILYGSITTAHRLPAQAEKVLEGGIKKVEDWNYVSIFSRISFKLLQFTPRPQKQYFGIRRLQMAVKQWFLHLQYYDFLWNR